MKRYTTPQYILASMRSQKGYVRYISPQEKRCNCIIASIVAFGAGVAVATLFIEYFGV